MSEQPSQATELTEDANASVATDRPDAAGATDTAAATPEATDAKHDDLLGELARAMHAAAAAQFERINAEHEQRRTEQVQAIAARSSSEVESLKIGSETDISAIDAWAKTETEKIKQERLRRIDARREQLAAQLERQETLKGREVFAVEVALDGHRNEIEQFFARMQDEADPAAIARVAATLPPLPDLAEIAEEARRMATAEFAGLEQVTRSTPEPGELGPEATVSESRLKAVMDPDATRGGDADAARPWETEPYAVSVAAGTGATTTTTEPESVTPNRAGSTLLRTVRSIRPMSNRNGDNEGR